MDVGYQTGSCGYCQDKHSSQRTLNTRTLIHSMRSFLLFSVRVLPLLGVRPFSRLSHRSLSLAFELPGLCYICHVLSFHSHSLRGCHARQPLWPLRSCRRPEPSLCIFNMHAIPSDSAHAATVLLRRSCRRKLLCCIRFTHPEPLSEID